MLRGSNPLELPLPQAILCEKQLKLFFKEPPTPLQYPHLTPSWRLPTAPISFIQCIHKSPLKIMWSNKSCVCLFEHKEVKEC